MPRRPRRPRDPNELAFQVFKEAIGERPRTDPEATDSGKNPHAVALGKLGGAKGGKARAANLTKKQRSEAAKKAARARWAKGEEV
jgi:hypothetical protein